MLVSYEPCAVYFGEWFKQLMAESEGKDGKGIFPSAANFSTIFTHSVSSFNRVAIQFSKLCSSRVKSSMTSL